MTELGFAKTSLKIEELKPRARDLNQEETADMLGGWGWFSNRGRGGWGGWGGWGGQQQQAAAAARKRQEEERQRQQRMALKMSFLNQSAYHSRLAAQFRSQANSIRV